MSIKRLLYSCIILLLFLVSGNSVARTVAKAQYAGQTGFMSVGLGLDFKYYQGSVFYGIVPEFVDEETIHSYGIRNEISFLYSNIFDIQFRNYVGLSYFITPSINDSETDKPSSDLTHHQNNAVAFLGMEGGEYPGNFRYYFDAGILWRWFKLYTRNEDSLSINDYVTFAVGINYYF